MTDGWSATVKLHVKVLEEPSVSRDDMVAKMTALYQTMKINVVVDTEYFDLGTDLDLAELNERGVDVGACGVTSTTADQEELFGYCQGAGPDEVCIYFVRATFPPSSGCGTFERGAVVASCASLWTLGHECGHVLGLNHVQPEDQNALMTGAGTSNLPPPPPPPPTLTQAEADTMIATLNQ
jgi:hypothetical protein